MYTYVAYLCTETQRHTSTHTSTGSRHTYWCPSCAIAHTELTDIDMHRTKSWSRSGSWHRLLPRPCLPYPLLAGKDLGAGQCCVEPCQLVAPLLQGQPAASCPHPAVSRVPLGPASQNTTPGLLPGEAELRKPPGGRHRGAPSPSPASCCSQLPLQTQVWIMAAVTPTSPASASVHPPKSPAPHCAGSTKQHHLPTEPGVMTAS